VLASCALPGIFPPVEIEGHLLMDGGVVNNAPISLALEHGADRVIVLPTGYACALARPPRSAIGMVLHAFTLAIQQRLIAEVAALQDSVDLRVVPPLCPLDVAPMDFSHSATLIERAYQSTRSWMAEGAPSVAESLQPHRH
jgi:NTE family protein